MIMFVLSAVTLTASQDIPRLDWQPRSDWLNVKTGVTPAAVGDGRADDTAALQAALDRGAVGRTIFFPPGIYRITDTLVFHGKGSGSAIIGAGRDTRLVWDGPVGGRMFWSDSVGYSRYVGLTWDGRGKAAVGFDHAAKMQFETEVEHEDEAFLNFTDCGIRVGNEQKIASAEILYRNCLFANCGTGLALLTFNDYDNTIDGCEFRDCGIGVLAHKSNFYARNSHFENSREADFAVAAEHGCSIRRCTSTGSKCFVRDDNAIAPLTIEDCHVAHWTDPAGAVFLASPTLMFDCSFSGAPSNLPPVKLSGSTQKLLLSNNQPTPVEQLVQNASENQVRVIPPGKLGGVVTSAYEHFLQETEIVSCKVFDAARDFGAKGDGRTDDTAAVQSAIDAARKFGQDAVAYLPTGSYRVSRTLSVTGANYTVSGSGIRCGLVWHGEAGVPIMEVSGVTNVTLADLAVGNGDFGAMNHGDDILVNSPSGTPCRLTLDGVYVFGKYAMAPDKHGFHFVNLPAGCVIDAEMVQGNLRMTDCARATLLFRNSYEGTVTLEGAPSSSPPQPGRGTEGEVSKSPIPGPDSQIATPIVANPENGEPPGLTGFLTRLTTKSRPALRVFDDQSVVMSDFYAEQSDQIAVFAGTSGQAPGTVTIQSPKVDTGTNNPVFDLQNYSGRIYYGQSQFYCTPVETKFQSSGTRPVQLTLAGNFWYKNQPAFALSPATTLTLLGNSGVADTGATPESLDALSAALDDLRRLGELDHSLSQTQNLP